MKSYRVVLTQFLASDKILVDNSVNYSYKILFHDIYFVSYFWYKESISNLPSILQRLRWFILGSHGLMNVTRVIF